MAKTKRQKIQNKSKPYTTIIVYLPTRISICGNKEQQLKWNTFFDRDKAPTKDSFIIENLKKDLNLKHKSEIFDDADSRRWDRKKIEDLMVELRYPNIQEYINFILDRAMEKESDEVKKSES